MVFIHQNEDFIIQEESVDIIFTFNDGIKLNTDRFCDELCEKFGAHIKCPMKVDRKKCNLNSMTFNLSCIINSDIKYSLKCYNENIMQGSSLKFEVMCNTKVECKHGLVIEGRPLKGYARKETQKKLLTKTPKQVWSYII